MNHNEPLEIIVRTKRAKKPRAGQAIKCTDGVSIARITHVDNQYNDGEWCGYVVHCVLVNGQTTDWPESARRFTLPSLVGWHQV